MIAALFPLHYMTRENHQRAFTLLELLVVLTLFSLIAGLALPRLASIQFSFQNATDKDEVLMQLADIGYKVLQRGYGGELQATKTEHPSFRPMPGRQEKTFRPPELPYTLPSGWSLSTKKNLVYLDNGICLGGEVQAHSERESFTVILHPPYCQPEFAQYN